MTGVGQVKHIVGLLRIEHQGVLVAPAHDRHEFLEHKLPHLLAALGLTLLVLVVVGHLLAEDGQRIVEIGFLQHGMAGLAHT